MGVVWIYFCSSQHMYKLCEFTLLCYYVKKFKPHFYSEKKKPNQIISIIPLAIKTSLAEFPSCFADLPFIYTGLKRALQI